MAAVPDRPGRRPLPPPTNDPPAPSLPPRPGGRGPRQLPPPQETDSSDEFESEDSSGPGEIYDDCEEQLPQQPVLPQRPVGRTLPQPHPQEEVYDDCNEERETQQLPSEIQTTRSEPEFLEVYADFEEVYDDFEEERQEKQLPKRLGIPLPPHPAAPPEESYDDLENLGPVVVQPKKLIASRNLPPPPPSASQMENGRKQSMTRLEVGSKERSSSTSPVRSPGRDHRDSSPQSLSRAQNYHFPAKNNPSPKGTIDRNLTPVPVLREGDGRGRGPELPPLPPIHSKQQMPSAVKGPNRTDMESSPVIVPLGHPKKGVLPPVPPLSEKPFRPEPPVKVFGGRAVETEDDDVLEADEPDLDSDGFPPPPSPISGKKQAIVPPPPPPFITPFPSSVEQDNVYEVSPDFEEEPSSPPLPPKSDSKPSKSAPKAPSLPAGGFLVDQSQINALKSNLRKVCVDSPKNTPHEPKEYGDNHSITELHQIFQQKIKNSESSDKRALGVQSNSTHHPSALAPVASPSSDITSITSDMTCGSSFLQHDLESPPLPPRHVSLTASPSSMTKPGKPSPSAETSSTPMHKNTASGAPPPLPPLAKAPTAVLSPVTKQQFFDDADEIYDDASSADLLDRFDWYHGTIDRKEGELRVKYVGEDGTYLVRISSKNTKFPYTLVVLHKGHASNLHIRLRSDQKYALGDEKDDEMAFSDLPEMISHHQKNPVLLMGNIKSQVTLQKTPKK